MVNETKNLMVNETKHSPVRKTSHSLSRFPRPRERSCDLERGHVVLLDPSLRERACMLCTGGPDVIRKEAWPFYRTISGVRLCWELEEPKGPKGRPCWY
ncbi:hypothetical protein T484DRAFT_1875478 [Baffinella frigidus]|nr:hypothetical protein T484DRAFT_1875478 [Cryptophyta sp. CCMP2293]